MSVLEDFKTALSDINTEVTGANSIYKKTLTELNTLYTEFGMSQKDKANAIAQVSAQLAVSATNAAIAAAVDIAKSSELLAAQVATEKENTKYLTAKIEVTKESRLDNLLIEDMKAQQQQIATAAAGGLVVKTADFVAANNLRSAVYQKSQGKLGTELSSISFVAGSAFTVAT